jgi:spore germination protein YaaH
MGRPAIKAVLAVALLIVVVLVGFGLLFYRNEKPEEELSAWIADWQWDEGFADFRALASRIDSVQAFAVYFDENDRPFQTKEWKQAIAAIREAAGANSIRVYLTFVNDIVFADGSSSQKDAALISRLMASEESRSSLIGQILEIAAAFPLNGVEIDFERIKPEDWNRVILFYEELYRRLKASALRLRIVLEPQAPLEKLRWPAGPEYVVMAYNLYGTHSGPGPKANDALIRQLARRMSRLPGRNVMAVAAGGFDWSETGEVSPVTERQALALMPRNLSGSARDEASGSVYFDYVDEQGIRHTVWYADRVTLKRWIAVSKQEGIYKTAIWKLGGLATSTLDGLRR